MKHTQKCPKCEGREFAVNTQEIAPINLTTHVDGDIKRGSFEAWICLGCGYSEFYARGLSGIRELAAKAPHQLRIVDATPKDGPYR